MPAVTNIPVKYTVIHEYLIKEKIGIREILIYKYGMQMALFIDYDAYILRDYIWCKPYSYDGFLAKYDRIFRLVCTTNCVYNRLVSEYDEHIPAQYC